MRAEASAAEREAKAKKLALYQKAIRAAIHHCKTDDRSTKAWEVNTRLLTMNPDDYELWGYRRRWLLESWAARPLDRGALVHGEMALTETALKRQPKSYLTWLHRRWTVALALNGTAGMRGAAKIVPLGAEAGAPAGGDEAAEDTAGTAPPFGVAVASELALCGRLLEADHRNFHCHNYRRWLLAVGEVPSKEDEATTRALLAANPSNYSAWHQRSHALSAAGKCGEAACRPMPAESLKTELEFLRAALYTEPDDSSGWVYHRWLLAQLAAAARASGRAAVPSTLLRAPAGEGHGGEGGAGAWQSVRSPGPAGAASGAEPPVSRSEAVALLRSELDACGELRRMEEADFDGAAAPATSTGLGPGKWPTLAQAAILQALVAAGEATDAERSELTASFASLRAKDPKHAAFYRYAEKNGTLALASAS